MYKKKSLNFTEGKAVNKHVQENESRQIIRTLNEAAAQTSFPENMNERWSFTQRRVKHGRRRGHGHHEQPLEPHLRGFLSHQFLRQRQNPPQTSRDWAS